MPEPDDRIFQARLAQARALRQLSQADLGKKTGIPASSISHFEAGTRKPSFDNLRRLANALSVSTDYLLGRVEAPELVGDADQLHRHAQHLTDQDRDLAEAFIQMLSKRSKKG